MAEQAENTTPVKSNDEIDLIEVFQKIWAGRKTIYKSIAVFLVLGIIIVIGTPKEYKSEITLLVETGANSSGMGGLLQQFGGLAGINIGAGTGEDALTPELYPNIIKSTPFLLEIMDQRVTNSKTGKTETVAEYLDKDTRSGVIGIVLGYTVGLPGKVIGWIKGKPENRQEQRTKNLEGPLQLTAKQNDITKTLIGIIKARSGESDNTLVISIETQDPMVSAQLADSVVKSLTSYIIDYRTQKAKTDLKFVSDRHAEAEARYKKAQQNLAGYRDRNQNVILASAQTSEQNLQAEYNLAFNIFNTLSQQLEQAKMKVQEKTPVFKVMEPSKVALQKSKPRTSLIMIAMVFLGGFGGIGIIFFKMMGFIYKSKTNHENG